MLARTVSSVWQKRPADATAIHLHHIDLGYEPIRQEIITRLQQGAFAPAMTNDVAGAGGKRSLAEDLDFQHYKGIAPYTAYVARTVFLHSLAYNDPLKGLSAEHLRYSMLCPALDLGFIEDARKRFLSESAYLDDRPGVPMRFLVEANLTQIIRRQEQHVDPSESRAQLGDLIKDIFKGQVFETVSFPGGPYDVPDEVGDGRPRLVVMSYDGVSIGVTVDAAPGADRQDFRAQGL